MVLKDERVISNPDPFNLATKDFKGFRLQRAHDNNLHIEECSNADADEAKITDNNILQIIGINKKPYVLITHNQIGISENSDLWFNCNPIAKGVKCHLNDNYTISPIDSPELVLGKNNEETGKKWKFVK